MLQLIGLGVVLEGEQRADHVYGYRGVGALRQVYRQNADYRKIQLFLATYRDGEGAAKGTDQERNGKHMRGKINLSPENGQQIVDTAFDAQSDADERYQYNVSYCTLFHVVPLS